MTVTFWKSVGYIPPVERNPAHAGCCTCARSAAHTTACGGIRPCFALEEIRGVGFLLLAPGAAACHHSTLNGRGVYWYSAEQVSEKAEPFKHLNCCLFCLWRARATHQGFLNRRGELQICFASYTRSTASRGCWVST